MKRYVVIFEDSAQADVRKSYDWGCRARGKHEAQQWARQLRTAALKTARRDPKRIPARARGRRVLRRDSSDGRRPLSRAVYDKGTQGSVLHVRGAYVAALDQLEDDR
jgi:plasmid stabilization system protein ParE